MAIGRRGRWLGPSMVTAMLCVMAPQAAWGHPALTPEEQRSAVETYGQLHGASLDALRRSVPSRVQSQSRSLLRAVPKARCGPDDRPETGLQGQVPWPDRLSGRAAQGYSCNLRLVARHQDNGFANLDSYKNCAYYTDNEGGQVVEGDGVVLDLSDPARPVETARLGARAMGNGGESLRVNQARGLLVSDHYNAGNGAAPLDIYRTLAVYDVSKDCRKPELLADVVMPTAEGHEGCFSPDGMVYYMASLETITPIDLSDPRHPKQLSEPWLFPIHGCSISDDGTRGYFARIGLTDPAIGGVLVVDTSQAQARMADAVPKGVGFHPTPDGLVQQSTIPLSYGGRPYVFNWPEGVLLAPSAGARSSQCGDPGAVATFAYPRIIDVADERKPREVSKLLKEVDLPENCAAVAGDDTHHTLGLDQGDAFWRLVSTLFLYDAHYCRTDRQHDPTIVGCVEFASGLRVFDIRDPKAPKEIAYYNPGTAGATDPTVDFILSPPIIRRDLGQIWVVSLLKGFHVLEFRDGVWPFKDADPCPGGYDYAADQYDLGYRACLAARQVTPAPRANAMIALPSNRRCRTGRALTIRLAHPSTGRITRARVYVAGKLVRDVRGNRIPRAIRLRTPPRGSYTVRVVVETTTGKSRQTRRYRSCTRSRR